MKPDIVPATPDRWADFEKLFGRSGACYGCWCMHWRLSHAERSRTGAAEAKSMIRTRIGDGPPPGLLAYVGGDCVGWVQVTPRSDVPRFNGQRAASRPLEPEDADDPDVWAITCFFFRADVRGQGLSHAMVAAAVDYARGHGARQVEACPMVKAKQAGSVGLYVGSLSVFEKAGFGEVARRIPNRPLMRLEL